VDVVDLEESLETKSTDEEIRRLKRMVLTFKRKYQRALQDIAKQEEILPQDAAEFVKKCQEHEDECDSLVKQQQTLKQIIEKNKQEIAHFKEENAALLEQQEILKNFLNRKDQERSPPPPQDTENVQAKLEEKESELRMAQQHLAKKMKENAELKAYIQNQEETLKSYEDQILRESA
jgi:chromosome segregation ATPase